MGTGALAQLDKPQSLAISPSSMTVIRGDLTYYKEGWGGSATRSRLECGRRPVCVRETTTEYVNNGFVLEERRQIDPGDHGFGHGAVSLPLSRSQPRCRRSHEHDTGHGLLRAGCLFKPNPRLTVNVGLRIDWVRRHDELLNIYREQDNADVQPRIGDRVPAHRGRAQRHPSQLLAALRTGQRPRLHRHVQQHRRCRRRATCTSTRMVPRPPSSRRRRATVDPSLLFD